MFLDPSFAPSIVGGKPFLAIYDTITEVINAKVQRDKCFKPNRTDRNNVYLLILSHYAHGDKDLESDLHHRYMAEVEFYAQYIKDPLIQFKHNFKATMHLAIPTFLKSYEGPFIREFFTEWAQEDTLDKIRKDDVVDRFFRGDLGTFDGDKYALDRATEEEKTALERAAEREKEDMQDHIVINYWRQYWGDLALPLIEKAVQDRAATYPTEKEYAQQVYATTIQRFMRRYNIRNAMASLAAKKAAATTAASPSVADWLREPVLKPSWADDDEDES
jgi:hypothetical protein